MGNMGRPKGRFSSVEKYKLSYLDTMQDKPQWDIYFCCSYNDMINKLKENYNCTFTQDVLQNIRLNRHNKNGIYSYVKVEILN